MKHYPHSGDCLWHCAPRNRIPLSAPCRACAYNSGLVVVRFKDDLGFIRCGCCDSPQYSMAECQQSGEAAA